MANRVKEDEKNEKIIRGLLKLPANRRCINCNNLGPQYVCTNFWTFICTNCSGVHREFTHRVKSISMAKFTSQEVNALREGGNEHAREIYFKEWDPQRHSFPDSSNIDRLRDFIKHVYVDRRYTGERNMDKPPRVKGDREDFNDNRRDDSYRGGSRSPPYGDPYERRYSEHPGSGGRYDDRNVRYGYGERSPGYDQGDYKRSPRRFEVVDDRRRDDRFGNGNQNRRFEDHKFPDGTERMEGRSPNLQKDIDAVSPPVVRPVREILGDDAPQLRVGDLPKPSGVKAPDNSSRTQRTASSSSMGSSEGNLAELKRVSSGSLIDFNADSEPPVAAVPHQSVPQQTTSPSATGGDWASFDAVAQQTAPQMASNANSLESALAQLSAPVSAPAINSSAFPATAVDSSNINVGGQWQTMPPPQQPSLFPLADSQATSLPISTSLVGASSNQLWGSSLAPNTQGRVTVPAGQPSQNNPASHQEMMGPSLSQPTPMEPKPSGRKELPEDLFTALYPPAALVVPGWQRGPQYGMGYNMQYPAGAVHMMPSFPQSLKSMNPFDLEPTLNHTASFPSMASLQAALPNGTGPSARLRSSSFGAPTSQGVPPPPPSFPPAVSSSPYMVQQSSAHIPQQVPNNLFPMVHHQAAGGFDSGAAFGTLGRDQHSAARHSQTPNSFAPAGGNPFG